MNVRDQGAHADIASLLLRAMIGHLQAPSRRRATEEQAGPSDQAWRHWGQFTGLNGVLIHISMRGYRGHSAASLGANDARDLVLHHTRGIAGLFFASLTGSAPANQSQGRGAIT